MGKLCILLTLIILLSSCHSIKEESINYELRDDGNTEQTKLDTKEENTKNTQNNNAKDNVSNIDINEYVGKWVSEDYQIKENTQGEKVSVGAEMTIKREENKEEVTIEIIYTSNPPANRIAAIIANIREENNRRTFSFADDGWMNSGGGTVVFQDDRIFIDIKLDKLSYDNWSIFEGIKTFKRAK